MDYQEKFEEFWGEVKNSVSDSSFAKLTMAKTIGKPDLKNIFVRPVYDDNGFKVLLKFAHRTGFSHDIEKEMTLEEAKSVIKSHLKKPFSNVVLFTTSMDLTLKINKKGAASIVDSFPSFTNANSASKD